MKSLEEYVAQAAKDGETRSGIVLGIRMALLAMNALKIDDPREGHRSLITIVETDRCLPDAIELVTGCRLGNRTLKFKHWGKMAATFMDLRTKRAIRIVAKESANQKALEMFAALEREEALQRAYQVLPDEELFAQQWVQIELRPEEIPGYRAPRVICAECGEGVSFGREVSREGRTLCRACAGECYFEPL